MPETKTTISEADLLATEAARRKAFEKLLAEAQDDVVGVVDKYRTLIMKYVDKEEWDTMLRFVVNTSDEYAKEIVLPVAKRFDDVMNIEKDFFGGLGVIENLESKLSAIDKAEVYRVFLDNMEKSFLEMSYDHRDVLRRAIRTQIQNGTDLKVLYEALDYADGALKKHAVTIARTSEQGIAQSYHHLAGNEAGLDYGWYTGTFTATTRLFCEERLDKVFAISEIERMDNGHGLPVLTYCGGYNCRHRILRVNPDWGAWIKDKMR